ncbi:MAG: hypothetical protein ACYC1B_06975 [Thermoleophilia bacterium]
MPISQKRLMDRILDFIIVLDRCYRETSYTKDRAIYANDLAVSSGWLARLHSNEDVSEVANEIVSASTSKYFTDYWRQGAWGEMQAAGLQRLQEEVRNELEV